MTCKICNSQAEKLFQLPIMSNRFTIDYFQCPTCQFIQTERPYWLDEAYSDAAITSLDVGAVTRNLELSVFCSHIFKNIFLDYKSVYFLDYGGATGMFTRLMRDKGFHFYHLDKYAQNVYAKGFELEDIMDKQKIVAVTSFEVFEHLENPIETVKEMFSYADTIVFSTYLQPTNPNDLKDWWYFIPETGQHIALYHQNTFKNIAQQFDTQFFTNGTNYHILTKNKNFKNLDTYLKPSFIQKWTRKLGSKLGFKAVTGLIQPDFEQMRQKLNN